MKIQQDYPTQVQRHEEIFPSSLRVLLMMTRLMPALPRITGLSNRLVKPIWCRGREQKYIVPVWDGIRMAVDLNSCIGGNLGFIPQLYDRWERRWLSQVLAAGDVFVDAGSNIGAYALWAGQCVGPSGTVLAVEPESQNYSELEFNVQLNGMQDRIHCIQAGITDSEETRSINLSAVNSGGHQLGPAADNQPLVHCFPLLRLLKDCGLSRVDALKMDIEGCELLVLRRFFLDTEEDRSLRPRYLLVEIEGGPSKAPAKAALRSLILHNGYRLVKERDNAAYIRIE